MTLRRSPKPRRSGSACVEMAVVLIFLLPLLLGVWEVGRLVQVEQLLTNAAREGGRQASAGDLDIAGVQQIVVNYLAVNGITCQASNVTVTNITSSARNNPQLGQTLDQYQITVQIPFNSVRWNLLNQITSTKNLTATVQFYSMNDSPISVNTTIPLN